MYSKNSAAENLPAKLEANKAPQDVYTDELFTAVTIPLPEQHRCCRDYR